jgi:hydrogenase-4 component B
MLLALILVCLALLLATGAAAPALRAEATHLVYNASAALAAILLLLALGRLLAGGSGVASLVLPLGLPWIGAHLRLDALAAFFLVVVNLGGPRPPSTAWATARTSRRRRASCRSSRRSSPA